MKKLLTITTLTTISLFSVAGVADVHAQLGGTISPTVTVSDTNSPTATVINKLLSGVEKRQNNQEARFLNIQKRADSLITARVSSLQQEISKLNASSLSNTTDTISEIAALNSDITGLNALKVQIDGLTYVNDTSITTLKSLATQIFSSFRVYCEQLPKTSALTHLQLLTKDDSNFQLISQNLTNDVTYAATQGKDTKLITADENKYKADLSKFESDLVIATNSTNQLTPAACTGNGSVYSQLKTAFGNLHTDVATIRNDFHVFATDFRALFPTATHAVTSTPTATLTPSPTM